LLVLLIRNIIFKASYKGYSELVSLLIHFGLDAAKQDKHGQTALHIACIDGNMATVKLVADLVTIWKQSI
jgi:ankyrin repeat protein